MPGTTNHQVTATIKFESDFLSDILITAFDGNYGGSWYWSEPRQPANQDSWLQFHNVSATQSEWTKVTILETGDGDIGIPHDVDWEVITRGMQAVIESAMAGNSHPTWTQAILAGEAGDIDADAADVIVQYGLFGEVKYG